MPRRACARTCITCVTSGTWWRPGASRARTTRGSTTSGGATTSSRPCTATSSARPSGPEDGWKGDRNQVSVTYKRSEVQANEPVEKESPMILVSGATGTIGKEVVKQLTALKAPFKVLARDPRKATDLFGNVEVAKGDFSDSA